MGARLVYGIAKLALRFIVHVDGVSQRNLKDASFGHTLNLEEFLQASTRFNTQKEYYSFSFLISFFQSYYVSSSAGL